MAQRGIWPEFGMYTLPPCLICVHEYEHRTLPYALHLRCDILVTRDEGVDPIIQQNALFVEPAESAVLGLYEKSVILYDFNFQGVWGEHIGGTHRLETITETVALCFGK